MTIVAQTLTTWQEGEGITTAVQYDGVDGVSIRRGAEGEYHQLVTVIGLREAIDMAHAILAHRAVIEATLADDEAYIDWLAEQDAARIDALEMATDDHLRQEYEEGEYGDQSYMWLPPTW